MNSKQQAVLNTKDAMNIIVEDAKRVIAEKFNTTVEMVEIGIMVKNKEITDMMKALVEAGVNSVSEVV